MTSNTIIPQVKLPVPEIPRDLLSSDTGKQQNNGKGRKDESTGDRAFDPRSTDDLLSLLLMDEGDRKSDGKKKTESEGKPAQGKDGRQAGKGKTATKEETGEKKPVERKNREVSMEPAMYSREKKKPVVAEQHQPIEKTYEKASLVLRGPGISKKLLGHHFIGSDPRCADISIGGLEGKYISARHAEIVRLGDSYYIEDAGSRNGSFVNGRRIEAGRRMRIIAGDRIRLADIDFTVDTGTA